MREAWYPVVFMKNSFGRFCLGILISVLALCTLSTDLNAQQSLSYQTALNRMIARPADSEASFQFAQAAAAEGRFREAIAALERVLILNPDLANIKLEIGVLYLRLGQSAISERFIREAINSPGAPPDVKARAAEFLEIAERGNERTATAFVISGGLATDSNANSGPDEGATPESIGRSDTSAFFRLSGRFSHDLGYQAGHRLIGGLDFYTRRYSDASELDISRLALKFGPSFNIRAETDKPANLQLTLDASHLERDGEAYLVEVGPTLTYARALGENTRFQFVAQYRDQEYKATTTSPSNDLRSGGMASLGAQFRRSVDENKVLSYGIRYSMKDAEVGYEAYDEVSLSGGFAVAADPLFDLGKGKWRYGINASMAKRSYDAADLMAFPFVEDSNSYFVAGSVEVPFDNGIGLQAEFGVNGNSSNYDINDFDNRFISVTVTKSF